MKIYPITIAITYASRRVETDTVRADWPEYRASLEDAMRHGAVMGFVFKRACDTTQTIIGRVA